MQKPRFRTVDRSAWVFLHTRLRPTQATTIDRRTAHRNGFLGAAALRLGVAESELPLPLVGETVARFCARYQAAKAAPAAK